MARKYPRFKVELIDDVLHVEIHISDRLRPKDVRGFIFTLLDHMEAVLPADDMDDPGPIPPPEGEN